MAVSLRAFFARAARAWQALAAVRLRGGRGVGGQALAPKVDGAAFSSTLPRLIEAGQAHAREDGFEVRYDDQRLEAFDAGTPGRQAARPVLGLAPAERAAVVAGARREARAQLQRLLGRV